MMRLDATRYLQPYYRKHIIRDPAYLTVPDNTYSGDGSLEKSWMPSMFRAFSVISSMMQVRDILIIGTGIGLDALGAIEIFGPASMTVTDITEDILSVAKENINSNIEAESTPATHFYAGDLLSCVPVEQHFCLVVENLPVVPVPPHVDIREADNSSYYFDPQNREVPQAVEQYLLTLPYLCLRDAYNQVRPGGGVLTAFGANIGKHGVPLRLALDLHRLCGYSPQLIGFDLKIQSRPDKILPSYRAIEEDYGVSFKFYARDALDIVATHRDLDFEGQLLFDAVREQIEEYALSTQEALDEVQRGKDVAHAVFMIFGQRLDSGQSSM